MFTQKLEILVTVLRQKYAMFKKVNFYISCLRTSVYSPASILLAETFYQELAIRASLHFFHVKLTKKTRSNMASGNQVRNVTEN